MEYTRKQKKMTGSDKIDVIFPLRDCREEIREARRRKPYCEYCGKKKPDNPDLHHCCPKMSQEFIRGIREAAEAFSKLDLYKVGKDD